MSICHESFKTVEVIELPSRLSMAEAGEVRESISKLIEKGRDNLVLDLEHVTFLDSSGLSVLLSARKEAMLRNGDVVLLNLTAEARALVELTRLHEIFEIYSDRSAAITRFI